MSKKEKLIAFLNEERWEKHGESERRYVADFLIDSLDDWDEEDDDAGNTPADFCDSLIEAVKATKERVEAIMGRALSDIRATVWSASTGDVAALDKLEVLYPTMSCEENCLRRHIASAECTCLRGNILGVLVDAGREIP